MAVPKLRFKEFKGNWDSRKFSDALSFLGTNSFSRDKMNDMFGHVRNVHYGDILVRYGNVLDISVEQIPFINEDVSTCKIKEKDYLLSGDVIIADTAEDYTVGKATEIINTQGIKIVAGLHTQACRPKITFAIGYIGNFINSSAFKHQVRRIAQGTKVLSIIKKYLGDTEIHFPMENEQQKIADFLTAFDKRIAVQQNIIADLEETKKGLLQKIFSQEIRFKDDNGQDYPDWKNTLLNDIVICFSGGTPISYELEYYGGNIPFIRSGEIHKASTELYISEKGLANSSAKMIKKGDLLYALYGANSGECDIAKINGAINQAVLCIRPIKDDVYYIFLWLSYRKKYIVSTFLQGGQGNLSASTVKRLSIMLPSIMEQRKIANFLSTFDKKITAEKQILSDLQEIKRGLLQQMFV